MTPPLDTRPLCPACGLPLDTETLFLCKRWGCPVRG